MVDVSGDNISNSPLSNHECTAKLEAQVPVEIPLPSDTYEHKKSARRFTRHDQQIIQGALR